MSALILIGLLLLNGVISWFNAVSCGKSWAETKALGGLPRLLVWCGAIQSAIGFSSILIVALVFLAHAAGYMPEPLMNKAMSLWYLLIIFPAISTGLIIMVESWVLAWRDRSLTNMGVAAYNTFASAHNIYGMTQNLGGAFGDVMNLFAGDSDDDEAGAIMLVVGIVAVSLASGALLTASIIRKYAGTRPLPGMFQNRTT